MNPLLYSITFLLLVGALAWPIGKWLTWTVRTGYIDKQLTFLLGNGIQRTSGWKHYFLSLLGFNAMMFAIACLILANQQHLPLNPDGMAGMPWHLVFNTAVSFVTNTNLQHYSGESTLSYLSQLTLMWLQFTSAATGIAAFVALARGLAGNREFGNFAHDAARIMILFLLPLATTLGVRLRDLRSPDDAGRLCHRDHLGRRHPDDRTRSCGCVPGHQTTRNERRRILRNQQHPSV